MKSHTLGLRPRIADNVKMKKSVRGGVKTHKVGNLNPVLVGPVPPIRGGIAKHTLNLSISMSELCDLTLLTPTKLYPEWIYPGRSQFETNYAFQHNDFVVRKKKIRIVTTLLTRRFRKRPIVITWWTTSLFIWTLLILWAAKITSSRATLLCHNVLPHDAGKLEKLLTKVLFRFCEHFIVQSKTEALKLERIRPNAVYSILNHPLDQIDHENKELARNRSEGVFTFLFLGLVREYKGVPFLVRAFSELELDDIRLRVVGEIWSSGLRRELELLASADSRVHLSKSYVPDRQFISEILSADCLVFPYHEVSGSGVLASALGAGKLIIASDLDGFKELAQGYDRIYYFSHRDPESLVTLMERVSSEIKVQKQPESFGITWDLYAQKVLSFINL